MDGMYQASLRQHAIKKFWSADFACQDVGCCIADELHDTIDSYT